MQSARHDAASLLARWAGGACTFCRAGQPAHLPAAQEAGGADDPAARPCAAAERSSLAVADACFATASPPASSQLQTPTSTTPTSTTASPNQLQLEDGPARDPLSPEDQAELMLQAFQTRADEGKKPDDASAKKPKKGSPKAKALPKGKAKASPKGKARAKAAVPVVKPKVKAAANPRCKGWSKEDKYEHHKPKNCRGKVGCTPSCLCELQCFAHIGVIACMVACNLKIAEPDLQAWRQLQQCVKQILLQHALHLQPVRRLPDPLAAAF